MVYHSIMIHSSGRVLLSGGQEAVEVTGTRHLERKKPSLADTELVVPNMDVLFVFFVFTI